MSFIWLSEFVDTTLVRFRGAVQIHGQAPSRLVDVANRDDTVSGQLRATGELGTGQVS